MLKENLSMSNDFEDSEDNLILEDELDNSWHYLTSFVTYMHKFQRHRDCVGTL
jgi:hypothetical protein